MPLSKEQIKELKKQLSSQIQNLPDEQKEEAQRQIDDMSDEAIELMLKQQSQKTQPVFRSIASGELPSKKLDENKDAIAVLDIKPISKGHTIIIPKHAILNTKDMPNSAFTLAKKISKRICSKLKAKGTEIQTQFSFGEMIINIIPIYDELLSLNSSRQEMKKEELEKIHNQLKTTRKPKIIRIGKKPKQKTMLQIKRKIP